MDTRTGKLVTVPEHSDKRPAAEELVKVPCKKCSGRGWYVKYREGRVGCYVCEGKGYALKTPKQAEAIVKKDAKAAEAKATEEASREERIRLTNEKQDTALPQIVDLYATDYRYRQFDADPFYLWNYMKEIVLKDALNMKLLAIRDYDTVARDPDAVLALAQKVRGGGVVAGLQKALSSLLKSRKVSGHTRQLPTGQLALIPEHTDKREAAKPKPAATAEPAEPKQSNHAKRVAENMRQMGSDLAEWTAVPIAAMVEVPVKGSKAKMMPQFDFPEGYASAPSFYRNASGGEEAGQCELCGHPKKP